MIKIERRTIALGIGTPNVDGLNSVGDKYDTLE
jgi:hypothetical protein